jgi:FkbM family methyltransferase
MKVLEEVVSRYSKLVGVHEWGFLSDFEAEPKARVLCVGCYGDIYPQILAECGFQVTAVDLREYSKELPEKNYKYLQADFCDLRNFWEGHEGFDHFICLDAIQYFGIGNYGEGPFCDCYDAIAMHKAWQWLKVSGTAYVSVPVGKNFVSNPPHWRIYNLDALRARIIQDFSFQGCGFYCAEEVKVSSRMRVKGEVIPIEEAFNYADEHVPLVYGVLRLQKVEVKRKAPDNQLEYKVPLGKEFMYNHDRAIIVSEWTPNKDEVCLDIGTGTGTWALAALSRGARVIVFEPCQKYMDMLTSATILNGFTEVSLVPVGLSDSVGSLSFSDQDGVFKPGHQSCPVITLDHYLEKNHLDRLDYINMDVEAHELRVIEGARETLKKFKPKVIVEVHHHFGVSFDQVENSLKALGYTKFKRTPEFLIADGIRQGGFQ